MPRELVKLNHLKSLDLSNNRLGGTLHEEIHYLQDLLTLDLGQNRLSGTLSGKIALIGVYSFTCLLSASNTMQLLLR